MKVSGSDIVGFTTETTENTEEDGRMMSVTKKAFVAVNKAG
jgi:hypothetical protein